MFVIGFKVAKKGKEKLILFLKDSKNLNVLSDLTHFRELGQKYKNIFVGFLVQMKTSKFDFEIN